MLNKKLNALTKERRKTYNPRRNALRKEKFGYDHRAVELLTEELEELANALPEVQQNMINAALPTLENAVKSNLEKINFSERSTGALVESIKIKDAYVDEKSGSIKGYVHFTGKDKKGVRNGLKAGVLEYGKENQAARPYLRTAVKESAEECTKIMKKVFDESINI